MAFVAREVTATLRVAAAAPRGWRGRSHAGELPCDALVSFVHGLLATAGTFWPAIRHLRDTLDVDTRTFTFLPGSDLDHISRKIDHAVRAHPEACRVHLVGHSLGGLAVRWYVQEHDYDTRVVQTISIAAPFLGVDLADAFPDRLRGLVMPMPHHLGRIVSEAARHLRRVPHLSIVADKDQLIRPVTAGILPGAPSYVLHDTGHNGALFHRRLHDVLVREVGRFGPDRGVLG